MKTELTTRIEARIANRDTIASRFGTDSLTTHVILQNCNYNFFKQFLANDNEAKAQQLWNEAHPFRYPAHDSRDYFSMDIEFVAKHLSIFGGKSFWTSAGWGSYDPKKGIVPWEYKSGYQNVELKFARP